MNKPREPIGEITCPLCKRDAELHAFEERQKLNPDSDGGGKPTYPKKHFVVCPPVKGYRGCGTILANGHEAQARFMELGRVFGPGGKSSKPQAAAQPAHSDTKPQPVEAPTPPPPPSKAAPSRNPFKLW